MLDDAANQEAQPALYLIASRRILRQVEQLSTVSFGLLDLRERAEALSGSVESGPTADVG